VFEYPDGDSPRLHAPVADVPRPSFDRD
jgi:hypothetical protein